MNRFACLLAGALLASPLAAPAQSIADLASSTDAARHQRLVEGARKEGSLTFYTSIPEKDMAVLAADFEKRYGVKVNTWRASTVKVVQRVLAEKQANRWEFDAVDISAPEMEALYREKALQEVRTPLHAELLPETLQPHRGWAPQFLSIFVQAYNTNAVKKDALPKSYDDLADPRWKGMLAVEANDAEWYCGELKILGREKGAKVFRDIAEKNGLSARSGHSLLTNLIASGEVPMGLTVYSYMVDQAARKGAPIDWFAIEPLVGRANGIGVSRRAPHPHAALLFYEYMISEAQPLIVQMNYLSPVKKLYGGARGAKVVFIDPAGDRAEAERCEKEFDDLLKARK
jgi:iron(III) transport system substrate-binding protein